MKEFQDFVKQNYSLQGMGIGRPIHAGKTIGTLTVSMPLSSFTRHGLVAGSTGTGKSRAVQKIIEELSSGGVPVFLSDVKGDVSGFCMPGEPRGGKRAGELNAEWNPRSFPAAYWSLSDRLVPLRFKVSDVGAVLLSRLLRLNPVQESHLNIAFIYAEQNSQDLVFLDDLKKVLEFLKNNPDEVSGTSPQAINVILRKLSEVSASQAGALFGEPAIELNDALKQGRINVLNLADVKNDDVSATAAAFLLYKFFKELPEVGETSIPKTVFFLDEAHVLFQGANKTLVDLVTTILRRIRSKGVGVFFITQDALDIPSPILKLLGTKIQFAMRAFTKKELDDLKAVSDSFPTSSYYNVREEVKSLPAGQSFVSLLGGNGESLAAVKVAWFPPESFMDAPSDQELKKAVSQSGLAGKYGGVKRKQLVLAEFSRPKTEKQAAKPVAEKTAKKEREGAGGKTLLRVLWVVLKSVETFLYFAAYKPLRWFARWLRKKPKRLVWVLAALVIVWLVFRYQAEIRSVITVVTQFFDSLAGRK